MGDREESTAKMKKVDQTGARGTEKGLGTEGSWVSGCGSFFWEEAIAEFCPGMRAGSTRIGQTFGHVLALGIPHTGNIGVQQPLKRHKVTSLCYALK